MYAKVFRSLWDGSLAESWEGWSVFVFLLAHADCEGFVEMTPGAIARRSCIPVEQVTRALDVLCSPDLNSRSQQDDGRRLVAIDNRGWGWRIVNYEHYRSMRDGDQRRREARDRMRRLRAKSSPDVRHGSPLFAHAEADVEAEEEESKPMPDSDESSGRVQEPKASKNGATPDGFDSWYRTIYPRRVKPDLAARAYRAALRRGHTVAEIHDGTRSWAEHWERASTEMQHIPYPASFLNGGQFRDPPPESAVLNLEDPL